ncbi:regulator of chromosome condensation (RCC1) repeat domain-containing protein [Ditylenchus destructor]|uniref:Regulator of chromosome condensation (RCC1) repeat domain-containing protein n=1 Tax=Ditylenchus destructor TaxID=166010 RepID=A0AAD4N7M2_9BILA|nr:regulator of chromosome condensation (RCC1) repeat domain-containing protein [Ditylenchus destructor]
MNYWSIHLENGTCSEKNTSASQTPDSSRTDATLKKWKSLWARSENVILQNIVKFNDALYAISDGKLVECGTNSYNVIDTESVLGSNETIVKLVSQFDLLLSLDSLGNVFIASPQNITDLNAKSDETAEKSIQFVKIELIQGHTRCVHGVNCTPERRISAKDISCTRVSVYIVDQLGNVWTFKRDGQQSFAHKFGNSRRVEVSKLPFPDYKIVRNVFCGSGHCIALVDNNQNLDSSSREEQMETNSQNKTCDAVENSSPACEKCVEEGNNRLSFLMESANEVPSTSSSSTPRERGGNADSNSPAISRSSAPTSRPSPRSAQNSPAPSPAQNAVVARLEGLRTWNFRRGTKCPKDSVALAKSSKLGQKSITYSQKTASLGQSSSSWRKQQRLAKHNSLDIELSTLGQGTISSRSQNDSEKQSSQNISTDLTGSIQFSFVSLDNVLASSTDDSGSTAATISDSDLAYSSSSPSGQSTSCLLQPSPNQAVKKHTQPIICDDRSNEILIVKNCAENMRLTNVSNVEQFSELWSWGENQCGQLGLSDTVARKEPQKIRLLPNGPISKVCCGDNHNIVLMTTGEAYVWGSNANGQFKQINYQYFSQPTLLKLGSESSILDVAASGNATSVIVSNPVTSGSTESHTVFHFSKVHSEAEDSPTIQINEYSADNQNNAEECPQLPLNLYSLSCGSQLVLSSRPNLNSPSSSHSEVSSSNLMKMIKTTKVSVNLLGLLDRILEQNQYPSSETSTPPSVETLLQLLGDLRSALLHWSLTLSHITQTMFHILKTNPEKAQISQLLTFSAVMRILVRLHLAYIDAVGYGCFFDVDIGPELESYIERLSLDYEAESSKQWIHCGLKLN